MTPERISKLVTRWARFYTRSLPEAIAQRRVDEISADLHDHVTHARADGFEDRRITLGIASRFLRGLGADLDWRTQHARPSRARPVVRVALGVALILSLPLVAMQFSDEVVWTLADFVVAGVLLATIGVAIELAVKRAGNLALAFVIGTLGIAACLFGQADDAPGLVLLGLVLIATAFALGARRRRAQHGR